MSQHEDTGGLEESDASGAVLPLRLVYFSIVAGVVLDQAVVDAHGRAQPHLRRERGWG